jgi:hypothetical protein
MAVCGVRNDYARAFTITDADGGQLTFDSFQCAIHRLAPSAPTAVARSSATVRRPTAASSAASTARARVKDRNTAGHLPRPPVQVGAVGLLRLSRRAAGGHSGAIGDYLAAIYRGFDHGTRRIKELWDLGPIAWLVQPDWCPSALTTSPVLHDDLNWGRDPLRHLIREVRDVNADAVLNDFLPSCLTRSTDLLRKQPGHTLSACAGRS